MTRARDPRRQRRALMTALSPRAPMARRSDERQPFSIGGQTEALVPAHEGQAPRLTVGGGQGRGELQGVGGAQRVRPQESARDLLERRSGLDLHPRFGQEIQARERRVNVPRPHGPFPLQARDGRDTLHGCAPPGDDDRVDAEQRSQRPSPAPPPKAGRQRGCPRTSPPRARRGAPSKHLHPAGWDPGPRRWSTGRRPSRSGPARGVSAPRDGRRRPPEQARAGRPDGHDRGS